MKTPKLYIKNKNGRYEEYHIPEVELSETLYRKINGRYVPESINCTSDIPEGVWVVTRECSHWEMISGKYLKEQMRLEKASDLKEMPSLAELGSWQKCANYVLRTIGEISSMTMAEIVNAIVGKVYEYSKKSKDERED